jgi:hypothetical protein
MNLNDVAICFNILVHESNECILNLIQNIKKYVLSPLFILHVNPSFSFNSNIFSDIENLYINSKRYDYKYYDTQIGIINSNYQYLIDNHIQFDYFVIIPSNSLCVKTGLENYISKFDAGFYHRKHDGTYGKLFKNEYTFPIFKKYPDMQTEMKYISNVDGCFFKKDIYQKIYEMTKDTYDPNIRIPCHHEEFLYPILLEYLETTKNIKLSDSICYINLSNLSVNINEIESTIKNPEHYFVKRVPRIINHPIRKYINSL